MNRYSDLTIKEKLKYAFILIAGITGITAGFAIYFTASIGNHGEELGVELAPLGDAAMEIKLTATTAHLWFEEIMSGDESVDIKKVRELLDESVWYCDAILSGGKNDEGEFFRIEDVAIRQKVENVKDDLEKFIEIANTRYNNLSGKVTVGSAADGKFDVLYEKIQQEISEAIEENSNNAQVVYYLGQSKYLLANSHLFLEERLSGDLSVDFDEVVESFEESLHFTTQSKNAFSEVKYVELSNDLKRLIKLSKQRYNDSDNNSGIGSTADEEFDKKFESFITEADEAETMIQNYMDESAKSLSFERIVSIIIMILISALAVFIALFLSRRLTDDITSQLGGTLKQIVRVVDKVSKGDLTVEFENKGKNKGLMKAMEQMTENLKNLVFNITNSSDSLTTSSQQITNTATQLSQGSNEQAASTEEVSSSMEEMSANVEQNSDNAIETERIAVKAYKNIEEGSKAVFETVNAMKRVVEKINVISEIAEKTDLLAINAAVEAARAGEHGKGFAVVAVEVRKLAEHSLKAALEIDSVSTDGIKVAEQSGKLIKEILPEMKKTSNLIQEISASSKEQNSGISQVNSAVMQLNNVTQQNAASAEEFASSSEALTEEAKKLRSLILQFKVDKKTFSHREQNTENRHKETIKKDYLNDKNENGVTINMDDSEFDSF